jgi:hypothetical protein
LDYSPDEGINSSPWVPPDTVFRRSFFQTQKHPQVRIDEQSGVGCFSMDKYQRLADDRSERELKLMECSIAVLLLTVRGVDYAAGLPKAAKNVAHRLQLGEDGRKSLRRKH